MREWRVKMAEGDAEARRKKAHLKFTLGVMKLIYNSGRLRLRFI